MDINHSLIMKKMYSYDCKLRSYLIDLISTRFSEERKSDSSNDSSSSSNGSSDSLNNSPACINIFDEVESKWLLLYDGDFLLQCVPILLQGSSMEGCSLARLANPTLKDIFEFEIDLNVVVGTVSRMQFEACYEPLDQSKAFFHYVIKNNLADDVNICINLPEDIENETVFTVSDQIQSKQYLSGIVLKKFIYNSQPTTNNPLETISVRGIQGLYSETCKKAIVGCSAFLSLNTETNNKNNMKLNLSELATQAKNQLIYLGNKLQEFIEVDSRSIEIFTRSLNEFNRLNEMIIANDVKGYEMNWSESEYETQYSEFSIKDGLCSKIIDFDDNKQNEKLDDRLKINNFLTEHEISLRCDIPLKSLQNEIIAALTEWTCKFTALQSLTIEMQKFCSDIKVILLNFFNICFDKYVLQTFPNIYFRVLDDLILAWSNDKSNLNESINLARLICNIKRFNEPNLSYHMLFNKAFNEFIQPELNNAIRLIEESLSSNKKRISTEILIDNVPCFYAPFWPEPASAWVTRKRIWPDNQLVESIQRNGFHFVPKSLPEGEEKLEWRLSFSAAESVLSLHRTEKQSYIYFLFKSVFYRFVKTYSLEKSLTSYLCKTVMMWVCEKQPLSWWEAISPEEGVLYLLRKLNKGIKQKKIKHYFIEDLNLLEHYPCDVLISAKLSLFDLENNFGYKLQSLLESMSKKIEGAQDNLTMKYENLKNNIKQTSLFHFSAAFIYKQNSLYKMKCVLVNLVKMFWYQYFVKTNGIYEEISRIKAHAIFDATQIDAIQKIMQFHEYEVLKQTYMAQKKKLDKNIFRLTALDKSISTYFSGLKSLIMLSCSNCSVCGQRILCGSKRFFCSTCINQEGFEICLICFNNTKDKFKYSIKNQLDNTDLQLPYLVPNSPCIAQFDNFSLFCKNKSGFEFFESKQMHKESDLRQNLKLNSFVEPTLFIESISQQFLEPDVKEQNNLSVISICPFYEENHQFQLNECTRAFCFTKFYDPPSDERYAKFFFDKMQHCIQKYYDVATRCVPLKYSTNMRRDLPGELMKQTPLHKYLCPVSEDNLISNTTKSKFENNQEYSSDVLKDETEKLYNEFNGVIKSLRADEKRILKLRNLIQIFENIF
ncbi:uncharacterized protein LOC101240377 isoform X2 [Hydra vulgaris]|uniref:uncharacterized protein LOC101240377 isoform X2 n=1 Tax=Hydra vulgaris TaxID=6087 RepID=UPI001F5E6FC5|nr:uncharacterized protein LOC101240377 isoform X2 [Hydra vulgaris]